MRISDWSSDVCSSDLLHGGEHCVLSIDAAKLTDAGGAHPGTNASVGFNAAEGGGSDDDDGYYAHVNASSPGQLRCSLQDRKSVVSGKSVSVRVDLAGRRIINKTRHKKQPKSYK